MKIKNLKVRIASAALSALLTGNAWLALQSPAYAENEGTIESSIEEIVDNTIEEENEEQYYDYDTEEEQNEEQYYDYGTEEEYKTYITVVDEKKEIPPEEPEKPDKPEKPEEPWEPECPHYHYHSCPKTGDDSHIFEYTLALLGSVASLCVTTSLLKNEFTYTRTRKCKSR